MSEYPKTIQLPPTVHLSIDEKRPQAGPLPVKRGEIGFTEGTHVPMKTQEDEIVSPLPFLVPHPADRPYEPQPLPTSYQRPPTIHQPIVYESTIESPIPNRSLFGYFATPHIGGLRPSSLLLFWSQFMLLGGTIVLWIFATRAINMNMTSHPHEYSMSALIVFIHVVFVVFLLGQLVLLQRRYSGLQEQRYRHLHPDGYLPRYETSASRESIASVAPWNRPALPNYTTVLVQSGVATGDVEDNLIAVPPPPAYGHTRGSTLILPI